MSEVDTANRDMTLLAPKFRIAVEDAIAACVAAKLLVKVHEGYRSQSRQAWLYAQGRTRPGDRVTNAPTSLTSWHGYGLAVDIVHATNAYWPFGKGSAFNKPNAKWFADVAAIFEAHGCAWGGHFKRFPDTPHMQWGLCNPSPSQEARELIRAEGVHAVWNKVRAL